MGDERIATIHAFCPVEMLLHLNKLPPRLVLSMLNPRGQLSRAMRTLPLLMKSEEPGPDPSGGLRELAVRAAFYEIIGARPQTM